MGYENCRDLNVFWILGTSLIAGTFFFSTNLFQGTVRCYSIYRISANETILFKIFKPLKSHIVSALSFLLCNENLNSFVIRVRKLFKGGNYSREETIRGNTVCSIKFALYEILPEPLNLICLFDKMENKRKLPQDSLSINWRAQPASFFRQRCILKARQKKQKSGKT